MMVYQAFLAYLGSTEHVGTKAIEDLWKNGPKGPHGIKDGKGERAQAPQRNWKQCAWKDVNDGRDYGLIKVTEIGSLSPPVVIHLRKSDFSHIVVTLFST